MKNIPAATNKAYDPNSKLELQIKIDNNPNRDPNCSQEKKLISGLNKEITE